MSGPQNDDDSSQYSTEDEAVYEQIDTDNEDNNKGRSMDSDDDEPGDAIDVEEKYESMSEDDSEDDDGDDDSDQELGSDYDSDSDDSDAAGREYLKKVAAFGDVETKKKTGKPTPEPISCPEFVFAMSCNPAKPIVATGDITGTLTMWKYNSETLASEKTFDKKIHSEAVRSVCWTEDGNYIVSSSSDKSIMVHDLETQKPLLRKKLAHSSPINQVTYLDKNLLATGDDKGVVKIWDTRQKKMTRKYRAHSDYISDFCYVDTKSTLLSTGGDGCLAVYDVRYNKPKAVSASQDEELLTLTAVKGTNKVVIGSGEGNLLFYSWGDFGDSTDRYPNLKHTGSIDTMLQLEDCEIIIGCGDGGIRKVNVFPHKVVGMIGHHCAEGVEKIDQTADERFIVSSGHDYTVKFWALD